MFKGLVRLWWKHLHTQTHTHTALMPPPQVQPEFTGGWCVDGSHTLCLYCTVGRREDSLVSVWTVGSLYYILKASIQIHPNEWHFFFRPSDQWIMINWIMRSQYIIRAMHAYDKSYNAFRLHHNALYLQAWSKLFPQLSPEREQYVLFNWYMCQYIPFTAAASLFRTAVTPKSRQMWFN